MWSWINKILHVIAGVAVAAGTVATLGPTLGLPAVVVGVATHTAVIGAAVGTIAAKVAPGMFQNSPAPVANDGSGIGSP